VLFAGTELTNFVHNCINHWLGRQMTMPLQGFDQERFAKVVSGFVKGVGYAVGVEGERVAGAECDLFKGAVPFVKQS
jgi:hypothetical protein